MNEKIFISYSRRDKEKVFAIRDEIEQETNAKSWIDLNGIESDQQFSDIIINAINNATIFLFMYSRNSARSEWTKKELHFATGKMQHIVFKNIDGSKLEDWFEFNYGLNDIIYIEDKEQKSKLIRNLKEWCNTANHSPNLGQESVYRKTEKTKIVGAQIHISPDANCRVYDYGRDMGIEIKASNDTVITLKKGNHDLKFVSCEESSIFQELSSYNVPENDYCDKIEVSLQSAVSKLMNQRQREKKEIERKRIEHQKKEEEKQKEQEYQSVVEQLKEKLPPRITFDISPEEKITFKLNYAKTEYLGNKVKKTQSQSTNKENISITGFIKRVAGEVTEKLTEPSRIENCLKKEGLLYRNCPGNFEIDVFPISRRGIIGSNMEYFLRKYLPNNTLFPKQDDRASVSKEVKKSEIASYKANKEANKKLGKSYLAMDVQDKQKAAKDTQTRKDMEIFSSTNDVLQFLYPYCKNQQQLRANAKLSTLGLKVGSLRKDLIEQFHIDNYASLVHSETLGDLANIIFEQTKGINISEELSYPFVKHNFKNKDDVWAFVKKYCTVYKDNILFCQAGIPRKPFASDLKRLHGVDVTQYMKTFSQLPLEQFVNFIWDKVNPLYIK